MQYMTEAGEGNGILKQAPEWSVGRPVEARHLAGTKRTM